MKRLTIIVGALICMNLSVMGQEVSEIDYSGGNDHEHFGWTLSMSDEWLVVGSPHTQTTAGLDAGKIVIYRKNGSAWDSFQEIVDENGNAFQNFGFSVDISGSVLVVGAIGSFEEGPFTGRAHVYEFDGTEWVLSNVLTASDASAGSYFGHSVATNGTSIIVGAIKANGNENQSGAAYAYQKSGEDWAFIEKMVAEDGKSQDNFGYDVDISENGFIVIGAPNQTDFIDKSGAAYIFENTGTEFIEGTKLKAFGRTEKDYFGTSVAINKNDVVVGAYLADGLSNNTGSAYYFAYVNGAWNERQQIVYAGSKLNDYFGREVAMSEFRLFVGAPKTNIDDEFDVGQAYYYEKEGSLWQLKQVVNEPGGTAHNFFGTSMALSDTDLAVGARLNDSDNQDGGAVYTSALGVVTSSEEEIALVRSIDIINYPNPTQQDVTIQYRLHKTSRVAIDLFDAAGHPIKELLTETIQEVGDQKVNWDLSSYNGTRVPSGLYLYKLSIDGNVFTKKIIVKD